MYTSLIYVSKSRMARSIAGREVDAIVAQSSVRNEQLLVRGALVFTEKHFAQVLEGPAAGVQAIMASIARDPRHQNVTIIGEGPIDDYRFPGWTLCYNGGASYMDRQVSAMLRERDDLYAGEARRLYELIRRLADESQSGGPLGRPSKR